MYRLGILVTCTKSPVVQRKAAKITTFNQFFSLSFLLYTVQTVLWCFGKSIGRNFLPSKNIIIQQGAKMHL